MMDSKQGQFDLDDGGTYLGGWDGNMAVGYGVCTDPDGQGSFAGMWHNGFEVSGVKSWPRDNSYAGQWTQGRRHGLGVEKRGHWVYQGEWTQGAMGRYGVRKSTKSNARYEGTWTQGLQDGYGLETYADLGTYQGQWLRGCRHGFGVRKSAVYSKSSFIQDHGKRRSSLTSTRSSYDVTASGTPQNEVVTGNEKFHLDSDMMKATKIGHFLASAKFCVNFKRIQEENADKKRSRSLTFELITGSLKTKLGRVDEKGNSIKFKKGAEPPKNPRTKERTVFDFQNKKFQLDSSTESEDDTTEIYAGDWKNDKRDGYGVCERSDGTKYEGQWVGNRRNGFGVTYYPGNIQDAGFYKDDVLMSGRKKNALLNALTIAKTKKEQDRVMDAVMAARKAAQMANQKCDIADSRMESARTKAAMAEDMRKAAMRDAERARLQAEEMKKPKPPELPNADQTNLSKLDKMAPNKNFNQKSAIPTKNQPLQQSPNQQWNKLNRAQRPDSLKIKSQQNTQPMVQGEVAIENMAINQEGKMKKNMEANMAKFLNQNALLNKHTQPSNRLTRNYQIFDPFDEFPTEAINIAEFRSKQPSKFSRLQNQQALAQNEVNEAIHDQIMSELERKVDQHSRLENQHFQRRLTLPNIVKCKDLQLEKDARMVGNPQVSINSRPIEKDTSGNFSRKMSELDVNAEFVRDANVIIQDGGVRQLVKEVENTALEKVSNFINVDDGWFENKPRDLQTVMQTYQIKSPRKYELGSTPDVSKVRRQEVNPMGWQQLSSMNRAIKEEIRRRREAEMMLRKRALIIRFGDLFDLIRRHLFLISLFALNVFIFYHLILMLTNK